MKIRALRLAQVGMFGSPTALEGLSGQLDVLLGPNEMGKSTLFSALSHLLGTPSTSKSKEISALRSDGSGAPIIEADIEVGNRLLRFRKRYLSRPSARLDDLSSGERWIDSDAEKAAERLLGADGRGPARSLLWVAQGASFALPEKPDPSLASALAALIEHEAANASGAGETRRVADEAKRRLEEYVTVKTGKARANGPLDAARKLREDLRAQLDQARARAEAAQSRIEKHRALTGEKGRIASPQFATELTAKEKATVAAVEAADRARQKLQTAEERLKAAKLEHKHARDSLERHDRAAANAGRLRRELEDARDRERFLQSKREEHETQLEILRAEIAALEAQVENARADVQKAGEYLAYQAAKAESARLAESLRNAQLALAAVEAANESLASIRVTEASLDRLKDLSAQLATAEARATAEAATATPHYIPGSTARLRIGGKDIADGTPILIERATEIVIEGVGTIVIEPPRSQGTAPAELRDTLRGELDAALVELGVPDLTSASATLDRRRRLETDRTNASARLNATAPHGISALETASAKATERLNSSPQGDATIALAVAEERLRSLDQELKSRRPPLGKAEQELGAAIREMTRVATTIEATQKQLADTETQFQEHTGDSDRRLALESEAARTEAVLGEAIREHSAWRDAAPPPEQYDALRLRADEAREAVVKHRERRDAIDRELAILEGALRRDGEDGAGSDVPALEEQLAVAEARVTDLETEVAALELIASRLERARSNHREQILRPIVSRLDDLLGRFFPDARVAMEGPLLAVRLDRGLRSDPHPRLSGGTREQIATLVRLAYADLMASRGIDLPLVLDDALVFSDDRRLEIMMELLAQAARRHQVILLSCHERAITPFLGALGTRPLALSPWDPELPSPVSALSMQKGRTTGPASLMIS